jgi:hypothetical protein
VTYQNYTFSTLGFAKNASVVKLQPKKAMVAASSAERKLMEELEAMKVSVIHDSITHHLHYQYTDSSTSIGTAVSLEMLVVILV